MPEPIELAQAKAHLRVTKDTENGLIEALIVAAREWVENFTGQVLVQREVTQRFGGWRGLTLHAWPIKADAVVSASYVDKAGTTQNIAGARLLMGDVSAEVVLPAGSYSALRDGALTVAVEAGYATPEDVPQSLKQAMLLLIGAWYNQREAVSERVTNEVPFAVEALCMPYRTRLLG